MVEPDLDPCAAVLRRSDPDLFHAWLFAPPGARGDLMVLGAFDVALDEAVLRPREPIIAQMRLQWWRDVLAGAEAGAAPRGHEVAGPLHAWLTGWRQAPWPLFEALIAARERELAGPMDLAGFGAWGQGRFGALVGIGLQRLAGPGQGAVAEAAGAALALGFALRTALAMAARADRTMLPVGAPERAALARGETTVDLRARVHDLAAEALAGLAQARRQPVPRAAIPALLPLWRAERVLRAAVRPGFDLARDLAPIAAARPGLPMLWRALSGRW